MIKGLLALVAVSALLLTTHGDAAAQKAAATPMLSGPLAKLDVKPAQIEKAKGKPRAP